MRVGADPLGERELWERQVNGTLFIGWFLGAFDTFTIIVLGKTLFSCLI